MGGFGSIVFEVTSPVPNARISKGDVGLWNDSFIPKMKELVDSIHSDYYKGVKIGIQIGHAGGVLCPWKRTGKKVPCPWELVSASAIPFFPNGTVPKELTIEEIHELQDKFVEAGERAKKCGFDFIEIHGAHGYLINQFLCLSTNKRKDKYGGSFENRTRFLLEIVEKMFKKLGEFPIFVRLSCDEGLKKEKKDDEEYNKKIKESDEKRWSIKDTIKLVHELKKLGVCLIDCSSGSIVHDQDWQKSGEGPLWQVKHSAAIKKEFGDDMRTTAVGLITKSEQVEKILKEKQADFVQLGRAALENPYIPILHAKELKLSDKDYFDQFVVQHTYALQSRGIRAKQGGYTL